MFGFFDSSAKVAVGAGVEDVPNKPLITMSQGKQLITYKIIMSDIPFVSTININIYNATSTVSYVVLCNIPYRAFYL